VSRCASRAYPVGKNTLKDLVAVFATAGRRVGFGGGFGLGKLTTLETKVIPEVETENPATPLAPAQLAAFRVGSVL